MEGDLGATHSDTQPLLQQVVRLPSCWASGLGLRGRGCLWTITRRQGPGVMPSLCPKPPPGNGVAPWCPAPAWDSGTYTLSAEQLLRGRGHTGGPEHGSYTGGGPGVLLGHFKVWKDNLGHVLPRTESSLTSLLT